MGLQIVGHDWATDRVFNSLTAAQGSVAAGAVPTLLCCQSGATPGDPGHAATTVPNRTHCTGIFDVGVSPAPTLPITHRRGQRLEDTLCSLVSLVLLSLPLTEMFNWMVDWVNGSGDDTAIFMKELWALGIYDKVPQSWKWPECAVTARNLRPILKSGPGPAQPLASPQKERLYLWEACWAGSPSFWAQGLLPTSRLCDLIETQQYPMVLASHVLCLLFVYGKTLAEE